MKKQAINGMGQRAQITMAVGASIVMLVLAACETAGDGAGGGGTLPPASREQPFVNSLGMKFVPVPGTKILMCTTETTVAQYLQSGRSYSTPDLPYAANHPVRSVTWDDAVEFCNWLSQRENRKYRLPTLAERQAAMGTSHYPWGSQWPPPSNFENYGGQELRECSGAEIAKLKKLDGSGILLGDGFAIIGGYRDRHKFTAPVGSYAPNHLGIYDMGGNVREWCGVIREKSPEAGGPCLAGACWFSDKMVHLWSGYKIGYSPERFNYRQMVATGFRVVIGK